MSSQPWTETTLHDEYFITTSEDIFIVYRGYDEQGEFVYYLTQEQLTGIKFELLQFFLYALLALPLAALLTVLIFAFDRRFLNSRIFRFFAAIDRLFGAQPLEIVLDDDDEPQPAPAA